MGGGGGGSLIVEGGAFREGIIGEGINRVGWGGLKRALTVFLLLSRLNNFKCSRKTKQFEMSFSCQVTSQRTTFESNEELSHHSRYDVLSFTYF